MAKTLSVHRIQIDAVDRTQERIDGCKTRAPLGAVRERFQSIETDGLFNGQVAHPRAAQCGQMTAATEAATQISGERPNVRSLGTINANPDITDRPLFTEFEPQHIKCVDLHLARWHFDRNAGAGIFVERSAVFFDG